MTKVINGINKVIVDRLRAKANVLGPRLQELLTEREYAVYIAKMSGITYAEIGEKLDISAERVCQILSKAEHKCNRVIALLMKAMQNREININIEF